jgi:hypothetical protein
LGRGRSSDRRVSDKAHFINKYLMGAEDKPLLK